jgi:hypothetical protein
MIPAISKSTGIIGKQYLNLVPVMNVLTSASDDLVDRFSVELVKLEFSVVDFVVTVRL